MVNMLYGHFPDSRTMYIIARWQRPDLVETTHFRKSSYKYFPRLGRTAAVSRRAQLDGLAWYKVVGIRLGPPQSPDPHLRPQVPALACPMIVAAVVNISTFKSLPEYV